MAFWQAFYLIFREGNGTPFQYSCLENPMDGRAWQAAVHGVVKSRTWLSGFTFTFHFYALEKEMATLSCVLAWRIPGMGSHRVGHDWSDLTVAVAVLNLLIAFSSIFTLTALTVSIYFIQCLSIYLSSLISFRNILFLMLL